MIMEGLVSISYTSKMEIQAGLSGAQKVQCPGTGIKFEHFIKTSRENCDRLLSIQMRFVL